MARGFNPALFKCIEVSYVAEVVPVVNRMSQDGSYGRSRMVFDSILQKFVEKRPIAVMLRGVLENQFAASVFDRIFEEASQTQYTKELAFSACAQLFSQVALGPHASIHAAFVRDREQIPVTIGAVYAKLVLRPSDWTQKAARRVGVD
jgi:hypothetical protein